MPKGRDHHKWSEIKDFIDATGTVLDPWQGHVLRVSLRRRARRWAAFAVGVCAPRQNGKNAILEMRELIGALILGEKLIIHSAHLADTSKEAFRRLDDLFDANDWLSREVKHIWRTNGHESVEFHNGARIRFRTRTRGGGRGFAGSPVIFDEPMFLPEVSMGAILPVVSAQPDPQIWYTGSAVDRFIHEEGVVFARLRERALSGSDDRLAYFEWSLGVDSPEQVMDDEAASRKVWAKTNPAYGRRITPEYLEAERRELDPRTFAVERLGVGDWPSTEPDASIIDMGLWRRLADVSSEPADAICFGFDVTPDRSRGAIGIAGRRADGRRHVDVVEHRAGTGWMVDELAALVERDRPLAVVCDGRSPATSLLPGLEDVGVQVETLTSGDFAAACGLFYDAVEQEEVRHCGAPELAAAVKGAAQRPLSESWAWSRKNSTTDISPLVAVTLALWGSAAHRETKQGSWRAF